MYIYLYIYIYMNIYAFLRNRTVEGGPLLDGLRRVGAQPT